MDTAQWRARRRPHDRRAGHAGKGIAAKLVDALIDDALDKGFKIIPSCSYVAAQFDRHPEWEDLRA